MLIMNLLSEFFDNFKINYFEESLKLYQIQLKV